jgi:hypothetical protein
MAAPKQLIDVTSTINISKNHKLVFDYFSNFENDKFWREEVNDTKINTETLEINTLITQDSFLSKKIPNHISILQCTDLQPYQKIVCETTESNDYWLKTTRQTESLSDDSTKVIYRIEFDGGVVKHGLGFSLPKIIVSFYTKMIMKKYLAVLKKNLEEQ